MQIYFAIPSNSAFHGQLEEFFLSISKVQNIQHIINQFVRKRLTFPDSPYIIIRVFEVEFSIVDSDVFSEWLFIDS